MKNAMDNASKSATAFVVAMVIEKVVEEREEALKNNREWWLHFWCGGIANRQIYLQK